MESLLVLLTIGVVLALGGVMWLHGHKSGVDSAILRATTIPSGVAQKMDSVVPGSASVAQTVANQAAAAANSAVNKVS